MSTGVRISLELRVSFKIASGMEVTVFSVAAAVAPQRPVFQHQARRSGRRTAGITCSTGTTIPPPRLPRRTAAPCTQAGAEILRSHVADRAGQSAVAYQARRQLVHRIAYSPCGHGFSVHQAAALVLARRLLRCSKRIPRRWAAAIGNGVHVAFDVPAGKRAKHVWTCWGAISGQLRPALAAQHRLGEVQS